MSNANEGQLVDGLRVFRKLEGAEVLYDGRRCNA